MKFKRFLIGLAAAAALGGAGAPAVVLAVAHGEPQPAHLAVSRPSGVAVVVDSEAGAIYQAQ
jgi:hypothetical protein